MKLKRLNNTESSEAGWAVGIILTLSERILNGEIHFTEEESEKLVKASEILNEYSFEEQIELLNFGLKRGVN
jgi:hypothetical protein